MSARQMAQRCPGALAFGVARLSGWQFMINQIGAAALRPNPDAEVYGVLWRCHARHMADLDRYEAVAQQVYFRDPHRVQLLPLECADKKHGLYRNRPSGRRRAHTGLC